eukprot:3880988-Prymnesium_polylepis.1
MLLPHAQRPGERARCAATQRPQPRAATCAARPPPPAQHPATLPRLPVAQLRQVFHLHERISTTNSMAVVTDEHRAASS